MDAGFVENLRAAVPNAEWRVADYSDEKSFSWLWDLVPENLSDWLAESEAERNLLIVWDGMPSLDIPPIDITSHLTPMDWALSLSHRLLSEQGSNPKQLPHVRVFIIDCFARSLPQAYGCR